MARGRKPRPRSPETLTAEEKRAATMKRIEERQRMLAALDNAVRVRQSTFDATPRLRKV